MQLLVPMTLSRTSKKAILTRVFLDEHHIPVVPTAIIPDAFIHCIRGVRRGLLMVVFTPDKIGGMTHVQIGNTQIIATYLVNDSLLEIARHYIEYECI
jgi:hypothetical protein